jgi:hypothetical protein
MTYDGVADAASLEPVQSTGEIFRIGEAVQHIGEMLPDMSVTGIKYLSLSYTEPNIPTFSYFLASRFIHKNRYSTAAELQCFKRHRREPLAFTY